MNKLLLLSLIGLWGCQSSDQLPADAAARASGRYAVQAYVFNGDTLYSASGINKLGVDDLYIVVDRKGPDTVRVGGFSVKNKIANVFLRDAGIRETNGVFQLSQRSTTYESRIEGNRFYERSTGGGWLELPSPYMVKTPTDPAQQGIVISAQK